MNTEHSWKHVLVKQLTRLVDPDNRDRAALAHLRRGLDAAPDYTLARVGWLFNNVPSNNDKNLDAAILVAQLFAWVKGDCPQMKDVNFGKAFGFGLSDEDKKKRERRFIDLIDTDEEDLPYKLRQAVTLIARDGIGLDWELLIKDLIYWNHPDRFVQKAWARGYWSSSVPEAEDAVEPVTAD